MKKITYLMLMIVVQLSISCSKDFLVKTPNASLDPTKIDESKIQELRNGIYAYVPSGGGQIYYSAYCDNSLNPFPWESNALLIQENAISGANDQGYGSVYSTVRACNVFLHYLHSMDGISETDRNLYDAEARLMRAWLYMDGTLKFGDLLIVTDINESYEGGVERQSKEEVRKWIMSEIDAVKEVLPVDNDPGKFNKNVAYALEARAAYYFGDYKKAEESSKWILDNSGKQLFKGGITDEEKIDAEFIKSLITDSSVDKDKFVEGIFNYLNLWINDYNSEFIYSKEYDVSSIADKYGNFTPTQMLSPNLSPYQGWSSVVPVQDLVDAYGDINGNPLSNKLDKDTREKYYKELRGEIDTIMKKEGISYNEAVVSIASELPNKDYFKEFLNRDSRFYASIIFPFMSVSQYKRDGYQQYESAINNYSKSGYNFRKMTCGTDFKLDQNGWYEYSGHDFGVLRLTETILIFAESHTQNVGYDNVVEEELNKLRERCGMPNVPTGLSKNDALDFIRHERRIELAGEGLRYHDIRLYQDDSRNGGYKGKEAAEVVMNGTTYDVDGNPRIVKQWDDRLLYMPIPFTAMDKNPKLKQNPGY